MKPVKAKITSRKPKGAVGKNKAPHEASMHLAKRLVILHQNWCPGVTNGGVSDALRGAHVGVDNERMLLLAAYIYSGLYRTEAVSTDFNQDLKRAAIATLAEETEEKLESIVSFVQGFTHEPQELITDAMCQAIRQAASNPIDFPGDLKEYLWSKLVPHRLPEMIAMLSDWLDCFGSTAQATAFASKVRGPFKAYADAAFLRTYGGSPAWPTRLEDCTTITHMAEFLRVLAISIVDPSGKGDVPRSMNPGLSKATGPHERFKRVEIALRDHFNGERITTARLTCVVGDVSTLTSKSKGATKDEIEWVDKHLRDGRGYWKWKP